MSGDEYRRFQQMLEAASGILLGDGKEYLVTSRLRKLITDRAFSGLDALIAASQRDPSLMNHVVDAMTTNETLWFRDEHPYKIFRERMLPEIAANGRSVRIWSAACSTGQEPYSLRMEIEEYRKRNPGKLNQTISILATDISSSALAVAKEGQYPHIAIRRGMNDPMLSAYFQKTHDDIWTINNLVRKDVEFRALNLQDSFNSLGKFDIIFCRNVLIYFSPETKTNILKRMHALLPVGGYLMLGASESLHNLPDYYEMVACHPGIVFRAKALS
ncbi:MAG: protein-glutamate O-methyltransferase CheR [Thalassolituus sp.]|uniref:CheR family methyltransferase n=1 Tax=Thalassolituus TaxID=187492 RepID=UPI00042DC533|nr:protein-glutamate O-methyltransferase CheR [Thalassolituus oleivorans]AHK15267.1 chemotaxis protein CheR [Thalassolituus oleivorans R6-15]MBQ0727023.1 protein-glutamate O-methyltransferase CheR [Thalassolituus oleivorans]MBQ0782164.1 protein-glutamate O-methyltransferase CheR [Thalassolituus oleivorans]MDF1640017.1 protein-glutamate O-methyltransferase CheR [Thalassolituus oleivorans]